MRIPRFFAAVSAAILLAGCGGSAQPAASSPAASAAKPSAGASASAKPAAAGSAATGALTKLTIIFSTQNIDTVPQWAAQDAGYFKKNGLDVDLQYVAGGTKTVGAMIAGQSQISVQGGNEAMSAVAGGADLVLIAGLLPVYAFKFEAGPDIKSIPDIKGKKLGVSTIGGTADVALRSFLRKHNIDPDKDVTIVATGDPTTSQAALVSGAVQGALSVPPNSIKAEAAGTKPLADLASEKIPNAQNSVTVQRSWLNTNRPVAQKLVDSLVEGLVRLKKDKAFAEQTMKTHLKYDDPKGLDETYNFFTTEVWPDYPHVAPDQLADGLKVLSQKNDKLKGFDPAKMIDDSLVQDAEKRGVAKQV